MLLFMTDKNPLKQSKKNFLDYRKVKCVLLYLIWKGINGNKEVDSEKFP